MAEQKRDFKTCKTNRSLRKAMLHYLTDLLSLNNSNIFWSTKDG